MTEPTDTTNDAGWIKTSDTLPGPGALIQVTDEVTDTNPEWGRVTRTEPDPILNRDGALVLLTNDIAWNMRISEYRYWRPMSLEALPFNIWRSPSEIIPEPNRAVWVLLEGTIEPKLTYYTTCDEFDVTAWRYVFDAEKRKRKSYLSSASRFLPQLNDSGGSVLLAELLADS